ncbi:MAG: hypothetical protein EPO00_12450 [Chloroflexota bacterium]|nr:MAG: hypothetical protein EPO00_12450 [Chloroflexota bacterium]
MNAPKLSMRERLVRPTLAELWLFLAVALPVLASVIAAMSTVDLAYQLRAGAEILGGSGLPSVDTWTFTATGLPWFDQQWAGQVLLAQVFTTAGWTGLVLLRAILAGLVSGLILAAIRYRAPRLQPRSASVLTLAAFVIYAPALALRPQLLAMVLFALTLFLLVARRRHPRVILAVPLVAAVWANVHGSFVLAPILAGMALVDGTGDPDARGLATILRRSRREIAVLMATVMATFATPFGWRVWEYAFGIARNSQITTQISEWQPPRFDDVPGLLFWTSVGVALFAVALLVRRGYRVHAGAVIGLVLFAALGAMASRGAAWWPGVALVAVLGIWSDHPSTLTVEPGSASGTTRRRTLNAGVGALLVAVVIALVPVWRPIDAGTDAPAGILADAPSGITGALRSIAQPGDRVWNPQVWGSWLEFAVPDALYALDSRIEVIPAGAWADAAVVTAGDPGWADILALAQVNVIITEGRTSPLATALAASPDWTVAYADDDGTIWLAAGADGVTVRSDGRGEVRA